MFKKHLRLDTQNWGLGPWRVVARGIESFRGRAGLERRWRQHQPHVEELTERGEISSRQNIPRFVERRLLQPAQVLGSLSTAPQHPLGQPESSVDGKKKNRPAADIAAHVHLHRDDLDVARDLRDEMPCCYY